MISRAINGHTEDERVINEGGRRKFTQSQSKEKLRLAQNTVWG